MNSERTKRTLQKILVYISHTQEYCNGQDYESFTSNRMLQEACIFNLMQIGELAKVGFEPDFVSTHPEIPWRAMYGMRNRIVHDYEGVRLMMVWQTITEDFTPLQRQLEQLLKELSR